jgi:hypothetical protein
VDGRQSPQKLIADFLGQTERGIRRVADITDENKPESTSGGESDGWDGRNDANSGARFKGFVQEAIEEILVIILAGEDVADALEFGDGDRGKELEKLIAHAVQRGDMESEGRRTNTKLRDLACEAGQGGGRVEGLGEKRQGGWRELRERKEKNAKAESGQYRP